jgi:hypothetical protein
MIATAGKPTPAIGPGTATGVHAKAEAVRAASPITAKLKV